MRKAVSFVFWSLRLLRVRFISFGAICDCIVALCDDSKELLRGSNDYVDVLPFLCTRQLEDGINRLGVISGSLVWHLLSVNQVCLIADYRNDQIPRSLLLQLKNPILHNLKRTLAGDIVDEHRSFAV